MRTGNFGVYKKVLIILRVVFWMSPYTNFFYIFVIRRTNLVFLWKKQMIEKNEEKKSQERDENVLPKLKAQKWIANQQERNHNQNWQQSTLIESDFWIGQIQLFAKGGDAKQSSYQHNNYSGWTQVRRSKPRQQTFGNQNQGERKKQNEKRIVQKLVKQSQKISIGKFFPGNSFKMLEFLKSSFNFWHSCFGDDFWWAKARSEY